MSDDAQNITKEEFEALRQTVNDFIDQYELDMRGDKDLTNGNVGIIGTIRKIKDFIEKYPSLTYLFYKHPVKAVVALVLVWSFLHTLYELGVLTLLERFTTLL